MILLAAGGRVEFASPAARRLTRTYFGSQPDGALAPALADWLESGSLPLVRRQAEHRLTVDRSGDTLPLEETREELGMTPRERQILAWVARGKTNPGAADKRESREPHRLEPERQDRSDGVAAAFAVTEARYASAIRYLNLFSIR